MTEASKTKAAATGTAPHIEELHEFFRSRGVAYGKQEDLKPFVERLQKDESFRNEMGSMVRAIIYRQRDGLLPTELLGLIVTAVAGTPAEAASEQDRDSVRQMLGFVGGVFRSRWNPGAAEEIAEDKADTEVDGAAASALADAATRPMTPIFYQAQVVANGGEEPEMVKELAPAAEPVAAEKGKAARKQETALPLRGTSGPADAPFLNLAGYAAHADPVVAFLREGTKGTAPAELAARRSNGRMWVAMFVAVVIAFCAGMFTQQWMLTHSIRAWPWHRQATPTVSSGARSPSNSTSPSASPAVNPGTAQPPNGGAVGAQGGAAAQPRRPAQVEAARSEWKGGNESASDLAQPSPTAAGNAAPPATDAASSPAPTPATVARGGAGSQPMTGVSKPGMEADTSAVDSGEARATAMLGASPALMESHLLFAPAPMYPTTARGTRIEGKVVVVALVGRDGSVVKAQAISGNRSLRAAAEQEVSGRRYRPYIVNDIPMAVRTLVTVNFPPR